MSVYAQGVVAPTIGVMQCLVSIRRSGVYVTSVDLSPMRTGDIVELDFRVRVHSDSPPRSFNREVFHDRAPVPLLSVPHYIEHEGQFWIWQSAGVSRAFQWAAWRIDDDATTALIMRGMITEHEQRAHAHAPLLDHVTPLPPPPPDRRIVV